MNLQASENPLFTFHRFEVKAEPWSFSRFFAGSTAEHSPDLMVLALVHPAFGPQPSLDTIQEAYSHRVSVGSKVSLCEPEEGRLVNNMEFLGHAETSGHVRVALAAEAWVHAGSRSERTVPSRNVFGGWPATAILPSTPMRVLRYDLAHMWPGGGELTNINTITMEQGGQQINDEDMGLGSLMRMVDKGQEVTINIDGKSRVPLLQGVEIEL